MKIFREALSPFLWDETLMAQTAPPRKKNTTKTNKKINMCHLQIEQLLNLPNMDKADVEL